MATPIKRIEKEFILKVLYDEQISIIYFKDRMDYILILDKPVKNEMVFRVDRPIHKLKVRNKLDLMFDYHGQSIMFAVEVYLIKDEFITCNVPESLYKNLNRSFSRISIPSELLVQFTFLGDRYNLSFPRIMEFESEAIGDFFRKNDLRDLSGLIEQMADWIKDYASGYKLVIFKDVKPTSAEERILAETGKALFLPSTSGSFPPDDPYPRKRIITGEMFKRYLESTGVNPDYMDDACARFIKVKHDRGIFSDAWVPILFQEYVIGYIHLWLNKDDKLPFNYDMLDTLYQFAKILAYSLKINGYFEPGKLKNEPFGGKVIDISVSGLLFAYPHSKIASSLLPDTALTVRLKSPRRSINAEAKIVRRYRDNSVAYFGCHFMKMAPEDIRFLFEFLYGKPFTDSDAAFLYGQV
ncbi:MAG: PilZ domain-containing protein [Treponema sp.]|jgi:hypothetical protein|nr:PilZ domain-containing protein [Treponema sp.]